MPRWRQLVALEKYPRGRRKSFTLKLNPPFPGITSLVSQQDFIRAQIKVFEELEAEECTEEACIRKIQELLQVDRLFSLLIIREGKLTHLTLSLTRQDDKIVREIECINCEIIELKPDSVKFISVIGNQAYLLA